MTLVVTLALAACSSPPRPAATPGSPTPVPIAVLPTPKQVRTGDGVFVVTAHTPIRVVGTADTTATSWLREELETLAENARSLEAFAAALTKARTAIAQGQLPPPKHSIQTLVF